MTTNTGTVTLNLTFPSIGIYSSCQVAIRDHAGNYSNRQWLDTVRNDPYRVCGHPSLTIPQAECSALVDLYQGTLGSGRTNSTNRLTHSDPEQRYGLTLSGGRTRQVDLNGNNLVGTVPASFGVLTGLDLIYMYRNTNLGGTLDVFSGMKNLVTLKLFRSEFSGNLNNLIPLTKIQTLDIGYTRVYGNLSALSGMNNLSTLYLELEYAPGVQGDLKNFAHMQNLADININTPNQPITGGTITTYVTGNLAHMSGMVANARLNIEGPGVHSDEFFGSVDVFSGKSLYRARRISNGNITGDLRVFSGQDIKYAHFDGTHITGNVNSINRRSDTWSIDLQDTNVGGDITYLSGKYTSLGVFAI